MNAKRSRPESGNALVITLIMSATALLTVAGIMSWSGGTAKMTGRSNQYSRCVAAAEAATEKVLTQVDSDFLMGGEALVTANLGSYRLIAPSSVDSSYWADWQFQDAQGHVGQTFISSVGNSNYTLVTGPYAGLFGYVSVYDVISDAMETTDFQSVTAGVFQEVQLTRIPIFQFGMYSSDDMEISCGQPFFVDGPVHSNGALYTEPDNLMSFGMPVSAVGNIFFSREPADSRGTPAGSVVFLMGSQTNVASLVLPVGSSNSPQAIAAIIQPPPSSEDPTSAQGRSRYYNQSDMIINVADTGVTVTSGRFNSFTTTIPTNQASLFISASNTFYDWRELKTVRSLDINVGMLTAWSATNQNLRVALGGRDVSSIYVYDTRVATILTLPSVRVWNGTVLPSLGLTVATSRPMYVLGNYNQTNAANLNGTNTITTRPASLVADAITILSPAWSDANSLNPLASRVATSNTLNAAVLSGAVYTANGNYSGGMENFMRFLEDWSHATLTYNGSLVKMFASTYATGIWGQANVYNPPTRNYYFDGNFTEPTKLPPLTPGLETIYRNKWATLAANQTTATNTPW